MVQLGTLVPNGANGAAKHLDVGNVVPSGAKRQALRWGGDPALPFVGYSCTDPGIALGKS